MSFLRRTAAFLLSLGFLIVAMGAAGGLLWALVDLKSASRMLGPKFPAVAICEVAVTLYALGKGVSFLSRSEKAAEDKPTYISHSFRK